MKNTSKQTSTKGTIAVGKQRSYNEIVDYLDSRWSQPLDKTLSCIKQLDKELGNLSTKTDVVLIAGSNGKSLTTHFASQLLKEEGLTVGTFYAPHLLTYNERFVINNEVISNKTFTDIANEIINAAQAANIEPHALDVLTMMALSYFKKNNVNVALLEVHTSSSVDPTNICKPKVAAITRVTDIDEETNEEVLLDMLTMAKAGTHVVSADQSKFNLQLIQTISEKKGAIWAMPIRKLAALNYPFEQLHGRCAALAERIAHIYVNNFADKESIALSSSLLAKQKGQRGRPTLEAKRQSELNPKRTLDQFWKETLNTLPGRFQLLDKEKPTILLDNASNLDAFKNLLLGIRLLHYQRPLKGLTVVLGINNKSLDFTEFLKLLRYFFKKTSGQVIVCPVETVPGHKGDTSWDIDKVTNDIKSMKIKAKAAKNFKEAFDAAQKTVDERYGLVVITGCASIVSEYWHYKGIKKLS